MRHRNLFLVNNHPPPLLSNYAAGGPGTTLRGNYIRVEGCQLQGRKIGSEWGVQRETVDLLMILAIHRGFPGRRQWHPTPVLLTGKSHGRRSLVGCCLWGRTESDTTERLHFHFPLSCIGEGNGNPLHCSCLENPRDGGAWWAAVYGVAQSWTRLT